MPRITKLCNGVIPDSFVLRYVDFFPHISYSSWINTPFLIGFQDMNTMCIFLNISASLLFCIWVFLFYSFLHKLFIYFYVFAIDISFAKHFELCAVIFFFRVSAAMKSFVHKLCIEVFSSVLSQ